MGNPNRWPAVLSVEEAKEYTGGERFFLLLTEAGLKPTFPGGKNGKGVGYSREVLDNYIRRKSSEEGVLE